MLPVIVVDLNGFALEKTITFIEANGNKTEYRNIMAGMPEFIADLCFQTRTNQVYLHGAAPIAEPISEQIMTFAKTKHNYNDLKVEVITQ